MKKLLFFDIDGTIVTKIENNYVIPESTRTALHLLKENGHLCFINSGRAMSEIDGAMFTLGMDGLVCGCGTHICYHGEELFHQTIPLELRNNLLIDLEKCSLEWLLEGKDTLYYSTKPYTSRIGRFKQEHRDCFDDIYFQDIPPEKMTELVFDKFCISVCEGSDFNSFYEKYQDYFTFIDRGDYLYEVVPAGCSKAGGMRFLMDYFNIPLKDTFAIGDSTNDLPMLDFAGTAIAMGNSSEQILSHVDYITDTVEKDGIYNAMVHFGLI